MTTTIAPSLGQGPLTQQGAGTSPGYDAITIRRLVTDPDLGEGATTYGSFRVSQRGAGANLSVDINMDDVAYVRGDAVSLQGLYRIPPHSATINETITTADGTNPRIDRVVLEVKDTQHDASGSNLAQTRVIAGTPTGGATLDNLTGAGAVPNSAILLADVLVAATDTSITDAEIRDRRPFAAGIPPLLTRVDMVTLTTPAQVGTDAFQTPPDLHQNVYLANVPRRIAGATRIRWRYIQGGTALTGNYVFALYDASGRKIIDTGSVAFTGALNTDQVRSETITATTLEPGPIYVLWGVDITNAGTIGHRGVIVQASASGLPMTPVPNTVLRLTSGGVTVPTTILGFTDMGAASAVTSIPIPLISLSVG